MYSMYEYIQLKADTTSENKIEEFKKRLNFLAITDFDKGYYLLEEIVSIKSRINVEELLVFNRLKFVNGEIVLNYDNLELKNNILEGLEFETTQNDYMENHEFGGNISKVVKSIANEKYLFYLKIKFEQLNLSKDEIKKHSIAIKPELEFLEMPKAIIDKGIGKFYLLKELGVIELIVANFSGSSTKEIAKIFHTITGGDGSIDTFRRIYSDYNTYRHTGKDQRNYPPAEKTINKIKALVSCF